MAWPIQIRAVRILLHGRDRIAYLNKARGDIDILAYGTKYSREVAGKDSRKIDPNDST